MLKSIEPLSKSGEAFEAKTLMRHFTLDVFTNCVFGVKSDALTNPNSEMKAVIEKITGGEKGFTGKHLKLSYRFRWGNIMVVFLFSLAKF